jgi:hypothetical protein
MTSLTEWAAISDIVGNAAVVISLLVVAFTVAQNTTAIRAQIDNHWYDSQHASLGDIASNSELLALYVKIRNGQTLSVDTRMDLLNRRNGCQLTNPTRPKPPTLFLKSGGAKTTSTLEGISLSTSILSTEGRKGSLLS